MATWPGTLPQTPLISSYRETPPADNLRTDMKVGIVKMDRRTASGVRTFECHYMLTTALVGTLDQFFVTTCLHGAKEFTFPKPRNSSVNITVRFVEPPSYSSNSEYFDVSLKLEELP